MITPEEREMELSPMQGIAIIRMGGEPPEPITGGSNTKAGRLAALGWKILPIPTVDYDRIDLVFPRSNLLKFLNTTHIFEWLIVPPEASGLPARKIQGGKITAIRQACRMTTGGEA